MKKVMSILLSAALIFVSLPTGVFGATTALTYSVYNEQDVADALKQMRTGDVMRMENDITFTDVQHVSFSASREIKINLNGHNMYMSGSAGSSWEIVGSSLELMGKGKIFGDATSGPVFSVETPGAYLKNPSKLIVGADVEIEANGASCIYMGYPNTQLDLYGTLNSKGGTNNGTIWAQGTAAGDMSDAQMFINIYEGAAVKNGVSYAVNNDVNGSVNISGNLEAPKGVKIGAGKLNVSEPAVIKATGTGESALTLQQYKAGVHWNATIDGGTFYGDKSIYLNNPFSTNEAAGNTIVIHGGDFKGILKTGGGTQFGTICGGTFVEDVEPYIWGDSYVTDKNSDGTYSVSYYGFLDKNGNPDESNRTAYVGESVQLYFSKGNDSVKWSIIDGGSIAAIEQTGLVKTTGDGKIVVYTEQKVPKPGKKPMTKIISIEVFRKDGKVTLEVHREGERAYAECDSYKFEQIVKNTPKDAPEMLFDMRTSQKYEQNAIELDLNYQLKYILENTIADYTILTDVAKVRMDRKALQDYVERVYKPAAGSPRLYTYIDKCSETSQKMEYSVRCLHYTDQLVPLAPTEVGTLFTMVYPNKTLAGKELACVYQDKEGVYHKLAGKKNADGSYTVELRGTETFTLMEKSAADALTGETKPGESEAAKKARIIKGVKNTTIKCSSEAGRGWIRIKWKKSAGYKVDYYQVYKAKKKTSFTSTVYYKTKSGAAKSYKNSKGLKKGTTYYYKLRGVRVIDGKKYYTKYSNLACRKAK